MYAIRSYYEIECIEIVLRQPIAVGHDLFNLHEFEIALLKDDHLA